MYIDDEKLYNYEDKISEEIRRKSWENVTFLIETILLPKNSYDVYMGRFISKVSTYFIEQYSNYPERVVSLPELVKQWIEERERKENHGHELAECYTALACMFQMKEDKENTEKYYKKAENFANKGIKENGEFRDYSDKAYLFLRFKKYEDIPDLLKKMKLLAVKDYEKKICNDIEECCKEHGFYFYRF